MSIKTIFEDNEKELLKENWHAIESANGICACGEEKGICNERLKNFLRSSQLQLLEAVKEEVKQNEKKEFLGHFTFQEHERFGYNQAISDIIRLLNEIK